MDDDNLSPTRSRPNWPVVPNVFRTSEGYGNPISHTYTFELAPDAISDYVIEKHDPTDSSADLSGKPTELIDGGEAVKHRTDTPDHSIIQNDLSSLHTQATNRHAKSIALIGLLALAFVAAIFGCLVILLKQLFGFRANSMSLGQSISLIVMLGFFIYFAYLVLLAFLKGFNSSPRVRVKVGNGYFDFDPKMSTEELRRNIKEAASK